MDLFQSTIDSYDAKRKGFVRGSTNQIETWLNARYTYCFARENLKDQAVLGIQTLNETLWDELNTGWFDNDSGQTRKSSYPHAFVLLAATTALRENIPNSELTFNRSCEVIEKYFWHEATGSTKESFAANWTDLENYRGANSSMHMTEAFIATYDFTKEQKWLDRALKITKRITAASESINFRIPEHFTKDWQVDPNYNQDNKMDQFRPFGVIPGHGIEWARLCLQLFYRTDKSQSWLEATAYNLYMRAKQDAFKENGFDYTTDFEGNPIIKLRMHWVLCEAISTSAVFAEHFSNKEFADDLELFWSLAQNHFIKDGYWVHELDEKNQISHKIWPDHPDIYHAYTAIKLKNNPELLFNA